jgi:hypothetical protein
MSQVLVVYTYNPSYSGSRDQSHLENIQHKKGLVEWLKW